jgi:hypothetical protein
MVNATQELPGNDRKFLCYMAFKLQMLVVAQVGLGVAVVPAEAVFVEEAPDHAETEREHGEDHGSEAAAQLPGGGDALVEGAEREAGVTHSGCAEREQAEEGVIGEAGEAEDSGAEQLRGAGSKRAGHAEGYSEPEKGCKAGNEGEIDNACHETAVEIGERGLVVRFCCGGVCRRGLGVKLDSLPLGCGPLHLRRGRGSRRGSEPRLLSVRDLLRRWSFGLDGAGIDFEDAELRAGLGLFRLGKARAHAAGGDELTRELNEIGVDGEGFDLERLVLVPGGLGQGKPVLGAEVERLGSGCGGFAQRHVRLPADVQEIAGAVFCAGDGAGERRRSWCSGRFNGGCRNPTHMIGTHVIGVEIGDLSGGGFGSEIVIGPLPVSCCGRLRLARGCVVRDGDNGRGRARGSRGGMELGERGLRGGLRLHGDLGGDFGGTDCNAGLLGLHLGVAGRFGVTGCDAGCRLGGAAGAGSYGLGRSRGLRICGLAVLVFREAPVHFLPPFGGDGLAKCAHSYIPFKFKRASYTSNRSLSPEPLSFGLPKKGRRLLS